MNMYIDEEVMCVYYLKLFSTIINILILYIYTYIYIHVYKTKKTSRLDLQGEYQ